MANPRPRPPPPNWSRVASPLERRITDWDDYVGRFEAVQDAEVRPRVSGQIARIMLQPGQRVTRGQVLFEIDPRPYRAALAQAQAEVVRAQAVLTNAHQERVRAAALVQAQAVSPEELEQKEATERTATAGLQAARAALQSRVLDVEFTVIRAPIAGLISDKRVSIGDYVTAGQTPLTRVVSLNPIRFTFDGAESLYRKYMHEAEKGGRPSSRTAPNPIDIQLANAQSAAIQAQADRANTQITLFKALGGGWQGAPEPERKRIEMVAHSHGAAGQYRRCPRRQLLWRPCVARASGRENT